MTVEALAEALQQARAAAEVAEREHQRLCDFLRAQVQQRDSDAVRASLESERVGPLVWFHQFGLAVQSAPSCTQSISSVGVATLHQSSVWAAATVGAWQAT